MDAMDAIVLEPGAGRALAVGPVGLSVKEDGTHHAPPRFPLHIFAVDGETVLGREWPLTRPYHA
jgi:hypothetical protein